MTLDVTIKEPGPGGMRLTQVPLDMTLAEALGPEGAEITDAYERLIMDVIRGNQTLFMRGDEVEAAWAWTDPIIEGWERRGDVPKPYDQGSAGPEDAQMLMRRGRAALAPHRRHPRGRPSGRGGGVTRAPRGSGVARGAGAGDPGPRRGPSARRSGGSRPTLRGRRGGPVRSDEGIRGAPWRRVGLDPPSPAPRRAATWSW